ncbi:MAG: hypothetical protein IJQ50_02505 [Clostridia bacterium]|nr:hypothetical protein [Clostridia bacterium]
MSEKQYLGYLEKLSSEKAYEELENICDNAIDKVINAKDIKPGEGRVIYVSALGDDKNDGLSEETPVKSLKRVRNMLAENDTVLFRRGDMFRGALCAFDGNTFGAYGKGKKPIINGSKMNYAKGELWKKTDKENVYVCKEGFSNIGVILFDPSYEYGNYDEKYGEMKPFGTDDFTDDLDFYCDMKTGKLYLYCEGGNPGERFSDIEIGDYISLVFGEGKDVTIDNIWFMIAGIHGVSMRKQCDNRTVTNCIFSWIGGSMFWMREMPDKTIRPVRYGNAVELYGGCEKFTVKNNWTYQIFDTGLTFQYNYRNNDDCIQKDIVFADNVVEFSFWGIEFYNTALKKEADRSCKNIHIINNFCRYVGYGWGCENNRFYPARSLSSFNITGEIENFVIERNIFCQSNGLNVAANRDNLKYVNFKDNVYVNKKGENFIEFNWGKVNVPFEEEAKKILVEDFHEEEPTFVYIPKPEKYFYKKQ